jgi:hypothetical protein
MTRLITSIRVDPFDSPPRDLVVVFASSGVIGTLAIDSGKGHALAAEMLGVTVETFRAACRVHDGRSFQVFASELPASTLSPATLRTIRKAPLSQLQAVANHRMDRLHTDSETAFLLAVLMEIGRRRLKARPFAEAVS